MPRRFRLALSLLLVAPFATGSQAAETCGWLPTRDVDAALPEAAPWSVLAGGAAGSCTFVGRGGNVFGANQMVKASADEAEDFVRGMRESMDESFTVAPVTGLGEEAFTYRPTADDPTGHSLFFVAHQGRVAVIGSLMLQAPATAAQVEGATRLVRAALALADDPGALDAATACPWFVTPVLRKLLPGKGFSQQSFGSNSCMAQADGSVLLVTILETQDPAAVARESGGDCRSEAIPALGPAGEIRWECQGGNPHAKVRYVAGNRLIEYALAPGREPTPEERALLIELARAAAAPAKPGKEPKR